MVLSPRAGVDSLIAKTLVIDMDETDPPNALHHHYTIDRYIGSGNTGKTFPSGNNLKEVSYAENQRLESLVASIVRPRFTHCLATGTLSIGQHLTLYKIRASENISVSHFFDRSC